MIFVPLAIELYGMESILTAFEDAFTLDNLAYVVMVATVVATIGVHEIIHAWVARALGCTTSISVDIRRVTAHTEVTGKLLSRREDVLITLAPLVSLTVLGVVHWELDRYGLLYPP